MAEEEAIGPNEILLRRIHRNNYNANADVGVKRCEFEPKERDVDGLSLYRETCVDAETLDAAGRQPDNYYIARISVKQITDLGMTVVSTPHLDPKVPGHVSIPQLSFAQCAENTPLCKDRQLALAQIASQNIVRRPAN